MNKMLKDTVATVLVVGGFLVSAVAMAQEVSRPWPVPLTVSESLQQMNADADQTPVNYIITASR